MSQNIIIADDHPIFRSAIIQALKVHLPDIEPFEAANLKELDQILAMNSNVNLLILDLHMPGVNGFEGLAYIAKNYHDVPIIMISADEEPSIAPLSKRHGAKGFIPKSAKIPQINEAVTNVLAGKEYFPDISETDELNTGSISEADELVEKVSRLTSRQIEVFNLLAKGLLNKQIAYQMDVTEATIKAHLTAIMRKLEVRNRTEVVLIANKISINQYSN
ncbi:MAG: response regulator transcription factor [Alphaproteobacteria bacterium]|nr:response regulator transcription factor [Alphaproteobacteria bacterium]HPF46241.1 response regulator transcription factor [Emcibacteraceae bacterium]HRW28620.1 response regulator transcription factor [Emcibacteraceae bacterium]